MSVPMVNGYFCWSLHIGTLIIGCQYTFWSLLELIMYSLLVSMGLLGRPGRLSRHKVVFCIFGAVISGIHMLSSILLVVASIRKLPSLTLPWTILTGILTAIYFVMCLTITSLILQDTGSILTLEVIFLSVFIFKTILSVYCITVVHSRHKQLMMDENEARSRNSRQTYAQIPFEDIHNNRQKPQ